MRNLNGPERLSRDNISPLMGSEWKLYIVDNETTGEGSSERIAVTTASIITNNHNHIPVGEK